MKFLVPNYNCLQNPWLGGYRHQIPILSVLCPQLNLLNPPPPIKIPGYATDVIQFCWQLASRIRMDQETEAGNFAYCKYKNDIPQYMWCILDPGPTIIGIATSFSLIVTIVIIKELRRNLWVQGRGANAPPILFHRKNIFFATVFERGKIKIEIRTRRSFGPCKDRKNEPNQISVSYVTLLLRKWKLVDFALAPLPILRFQCY